MGFFSTVYQVCSGTTVFIQLMERRFLRAFFHFFLLVLLLCLILATGHSCIFAPTIRNICGNLFEQIGGLNFSPTEGIRTLKTPLEKKSYLLDEKLRFDYCPGNTLKEEDIGKWNTPFGVLAMDRGFLFWGENYADTGKGTFLVIPMSMDIRQAKDEKLQVGLSARELREYAEKRFTQKKGETLLFPEHVETAAGLSAQLTAALWVVIFGASFVGIFGLGFVVIFFFGSMQYFWSGMDERRLTFPKILVVLIYTSFPAMLIASLYSFFMIPVLSPQLVFFIAFFVYYIAVFRKIRNSLNPPRDTHFEDDL